MEGQQDMESSLQPPISISEEPLPSARRGPRPPSLPHASYPVRSGGSPLAPHQPPGPGSVRSRMSHRVQPNPGLLQTINKLEAESETRAYELINLRTLVLKVEKEREDALARCQRLTSANSELQEEVSRLNEELSELRHHQTSQKVSEWLDGATGLSHVLANGATTGTADAQSNSTALGNAAVQHPSGSQQPNSTQQQQQQQLLLLQAAEQEIADLRHQLQQLQVELQQPQAKATRVVPVITTSLVAAPPETASQKALQGGSDLAPKISQLLPDGSARFSPAGPRLDDRTSRTSNKRTAGLLERFTSVKSRKDGQQWTTLQELSRQPSHKSTITSSQQPDIVPELQGALAKVTADREEQAALRHVEVQHLKYTHAQALKERDSQILELKQELADLRAQQSEALGGVEASRPSTCELPGPRDVSSTNTAPAQRNADMLSEGMLPMPPDTKQASKRLMEARSMHSAHHSTGPGTCTACTAAQQAVQQLHETVESLTAQLAEKSSQSKAAAQTTADLAAQLAGAQTQLTDVQAQAQKAVRSAADLAAQIANMEQQQAVNGAGTAAAEFETLQEAFAQAKADIEQLQMAVSLSRAAQTDAQAQHMQADADRAKAEEALVEAREAAERLQADSLAVAAERDHAQQQLLHLQDLLVEKDTAFQQVTQQLQAAQLIADSQQQQASAKVQEGLQEIKAIQDRLVDSNAQLTAARTDLGAAKDELAAALKKLTLCEAELAEARVQVTRTQAELDAEKVQLASAKAELSAAQLQFEKALQATDQKQLVAELHEQLTSRNAALASAQQQVADVQSQLQGVQEQLELKESSLQGLKADLASKVAAATQLHAKVASKDEQLVDKVAAINDLNGQLASSSSIVASLQGRLNAAEAKVGDLQGHLEAAHSKAKKQALAHAEAAGLAGAAAAYCRQQTAALNSIKVQLEQMTQERDAAQQQLGTLQGQVFELQAQLETATKQISETQQRLDAQQCQAAEQQQQLSDFNMQLSTAMEQLTAAQDQVAELQSKLNSATQEVGRLTSTAVQQQAATAKQVAGLEAQLQQLQQQLRDQHIKDQQQEQQQQQRQGQDQNQQKQQQGMPVPRLDLTQHAEEVASTMVGQAGTAEQDTVHSTAAAGDAAQQVAALRAARTSGSLSSRSGTPRGVRAGQVVSDTAVLPDQGRQEALDKVTALETRSKQLTDQLDKASIELQAVRAQQAAGEQQLQLAQAKLEQLESAESAREIALKEAQAGLVASELQAAGLKSRELAARAAKMMQLIRDMAAQMAYLQTQLQQQSQLSARLAEETVALRADADTAQHHAGVEARHAAEELEAARGDAKHWHDAYDIVLRDMAEMRQRFNESERKLAAARSRITVLTQTTRGVTMGDSSGQKPPKLFGAPVGDAVRVSVSGTDGSTAVSPSCPSPPKSPPRSRLSDGLTPRGVLDRSSAGLLVAPNRTESMAVYKKLRHLAILYQLDLGPSLFGKQHNPASAGNATSAQLWTTLNAVLSALISISSTERPSTSSSQTAPVIDPIGGASQHTTSWAYRRQYRASSPTNSSRPSVGSSPRVTPTLAIPSPTAMLARVAAPGRPDSAPAGRHVAGSSPAAHVSGAAPGQRLLGAPRKRATDSIVLGAGPSPVAHGSVNTSMAGVLQGTVQTVTTVKGTVGNKLPLLSST